MLRARCAQAADIQGIARAVGASRSALDASFWRTFEMTPSAYHARVRLTHGLSGLRDPLTKAEEAARLAGFASVKNFNRAVRQHTAMTPSEVRELRGAEFEGLLRSKLQTDLAVLAERVGRRAPSAEKGLELD
jgi:methylphosphotriester-DNA--protein-cysteine methyltransferase